MIWWVLAFAGLFILALVVVVFVALRLMRRRLTRMAVVAVEGLIAGALLHADPRIRILELDKALDTLLSHLGYKGTLGEKLMKAGARLPNINALWAAHKHRNVLAHEPGATATDVDVQRFHDAVMTALKHVS